MVGQQEEQRQPTTTMAAASYQDAQLSTGHMPHGMDHGYPNGQQNMLFADNSYFSFDDMPQSHSSQSILNTSDHDFLQNFFENPSSIDNIPVLNPYEHIGPDEKPAPGGGFAFAGASFDPHTGTISPSVTGRSSQPSIPRNHMVGNQQPSHANMSQDDISAASTIHNFKSTPAPAPNYPQFSANTYVGPSSWGDFMMPTPMPSMHNGFQMQSAPRQPRQQSLGGKAPQTVTFQAIAQSGPPQMYDGRHISMDQASAYAPNQSPQQSAGHWPPSQTSPPNLPPGAKRPSGPVHFGSDQDFTNSHYRNMSTTPQHDKEGNLLGVPGADQAARGPLQLSMRQNGGGPGMTHSDGQSWGSMGLAGPGQTVGFDDGRSRKRRKSQADDEDGYYTGSANPKHEDSDDEQSTKRSRASATYPGNAPLTQEEGKRLNGKKPRETLSEQQKRQHHIISEKKRREIINQGYHDLNNLVPCLAAGKSGLSRSECLQESASFLEALLQGSEQLIQMLGITEEEIANAPLPAPLTQEGAIRGPAP